MNPESLDQNEVYRQLAQMVYNFVGAKGQGHAK
jgi:hypothetical protein